jgi:hypothetical protein
VVSVSILGGSWPAGGRRSWRIELSDRVGCEVEEVRLRADDFEHPTSVWPLVMATEAKVGDDVIAFFHGWWDDARIAADAAGVVLHAVDSREASPLADISVNGEIDSRRFARRLH